MDFQKQLIYFTTFSIDRWIPLFHEFPETNNFVLESFLHFHSNKQISIYSFVIMSDHIHFLWEDLSNDNPDKIITSIRQYVGSRVVNLLKFCNSDYLLNFKSKRQDREHKIWKLTKGNIRITGLKMFEQKLNYIHKNPTVGKYKVVENPEEYLFSSALAYSRHESNFSFLTLVEKCYY